jgi:hypothetical protein
MVCLGVEATDRLIQEWAPDGDPDFEPVFWLAPAVTQWDCGRLEDRVKQRAVAAISDGSGVAPWDQTSESAELCSKLPGGNWNRPSRRRKISRSAFWPPAIGSVVN